jgi:hypothetical protein
MIGIGRRHMTLKHLSGYEALFPLHPVGGFSSAWKRARTRPEQADQREWTKLRYSITSSAIGCIEFGTSSFERAK